ncbi:DUF262 domain-containing protein [Ruficoccus amylovorans]|uniref:DUF262 domain-containing protein n=1 Tax=Ruficoccus amylovorans TaxID=1804625 RepID=A0A842HES9_9BACT|nr:DUF262 domain-containing protein [Ruficoccus amylovorans]MBC2593821.1 DUF262 domain-containing protein [Ruficoccus amylovorans]
MAKIENHKYTIEEAFKNCFYIVPDYQREYVWQEKEVQLLLDDIDEQVGSTTSEYFIGTILVAPVEGDRNHYEVIDGQQRLTTFFLMLCALRNRLTGEDHHGLISDILTTRRTTPEGNIETRLKLEPRYEHAGELVALIAKQDSDPETTRAAVDIEGIPHFGSLNRLLDAYALLHRSLSEKYPTVAELKKFWGYLASNVVFIQISADVSNALKIFETINERGVGLNPMDLLKNLLFTQVDQNEFSRLKMEWKKVTAPLEKKKEKPLRFLRYFIMANYQFEMSRSGKNDSVVREDEIYTWFTKREHARICEYEEKPFEFIRKITRNVEHYLNFREGRDNHGNPSQAMEGLRSLTGAAFSLHYILLLAAVPLPAALFNHLVRQLESFLFYYIFTKTSTKQLERDFSLWADQLRTICAEHDIVEQKRQLDALVQDKFATAMKRLEGQLDDALRRYTLGSMQKYRSNYLLAKITQHVETAFQGSEAPLASFTGLQIEHILPNNPSAALRTHFEQTNPGIDYDEQKNRLGNLTMLEQPHNVVAGNDFFAKKQELYRQSGNYLTRSLVALAQVGSNSSISRMNQKLKSFDEWNAEAIEQRQQLLQSLIMEIWSTTHLEA